MTGQSRVEIANDSTECTRHCQEMVEGRDGEIESSLRGFDQ
jgi:hypothetical protein